MLILSIACSFSLIGFDRNNRLFRLIVHAVDPAHELHARSSLHLYFETSHGFPHGAISDRWEFEAATGNSPRSSVIGIVGFINGPRRPYLLFTPPPKSATRSSPPVSYLHGPKRNYLHPSTTISHVQIRIGIFHTPSPALSFRPRTGFAIKLRAPWPSIQISPLFAVVGQTAE